MQFVNDASRADLTVGHGLASSTKEVQTSPIFRLDGRNVQLYDTPGFDDTSLTDTEILKRIAEITDNRMTGASVRSFELFTKICGLSSMRNVMIVTNMWSSPADPEEERRDEQLKTSFFNVAVDNGAKMARRAGVGSQSARSIVQLMLNLPPIELQLQTELARGLPLDETQAGIVVDQNLRVRLERQRREREELEEELAAARQDRDRRAQEQLERYKRDREDEERILRQQIALLRESRRNLAASSRQPAPGANQVTNPAPELADGRDRGGSKATGISRWTPKIFQPAARTAGARGREVAPRSSTLSHSRPSQAEHRTQGRAQSATPTSRRRGFKFRGRIKMMYWRRSRSETRE
ncbi:hypothetical protein FRC10_003223 [Ceratobasidium sp. 414]|nr:hypothetical protein FRC10_003223 [Ceratobasidium sp. 414]